MSKARTIFCRRKRLGEETCRTWAAIRGCIPGGAGLGDSVAARLPGLTSGLAERLPKLLEVSEVAAERWLRDLALKRLLLRPGLQLWRPVHGLPRTIRAGERAKERNPDGLADPSLCLLSRLRLEEGVTGVPRRRKSSWLRSRIHLGSGLR